MADELVSIIVPIYNVEKYLDKCLKSIQMQTYENIQVILINDGSPDNSQSICEEYCKKDNRFILVNKSNRGVSSARNNGLEKAKGTYITFVDSDDFIEPNYVQVLLENLIKNNADLSVCSFYENQSDGKTKQEFFSKNAEIISQEEAIKRCITPGKFYGFLWNKMLRANNLGNIKFDEAIVKGEDSLFLCEYIFKCKKIIVQDIPLYHYCTDSISASRSKFNVKKMSVLKSYQSIIDILKYNNCSKEVVDMQLVQYANQLLSLKTNIILSGKETYLSQLNLIDKQMRKFERLYLKSNIVDVKHKIAYFFASHTKSIFDIVCELYGGLR